jgi:hypothetical protein
MFSDHAIIAIAICRGVRAVRNWDEDIGHAGNPGPSDQVGKRERNIAGLLPDRIFPNYSLFEQTNQQQDSGPRENRVLVFFTWGA